MFAGSGERHKHEGRSGYCDCSDAIEFYRKLDEAGKLHADDKPPEQQEFYGYDLSIQLGLDVFPAATVEDWLFSLWQEIRSGVNASGFGVGRIGWVDLLAYQQLTKVTFAASTVQAIMILDRCFLTYFKTPSK